MKKHYLKLSEEPFLLIKVGEKTIELRLYDKKRQALKIGDIIEFSNTSDQNQKINCKISALYVYKSFEELYASLPLDRCGYTEENISRASHLDMRAYYSEEDERKWGVVGIELKLLNTDNIYVFDLDGTLINSMPACRSAIQAMTAEDGVSYSEQLLKEIIPLGFAGASRYYIEHFGLNEGFESVSIRLGAHFLHAYEKNIPLKEGVFEYLSRLKSDGKRLFILTANSHVLADACLKGNRIYELFESVWSTDDFGMNKASSDIYFTLAEKIGCDACEINYFDDSVIAVKSASDAGCLSYGVHESQSDCDIALMKNVCHKFIYSFEELIK
ncbi:MAG: HAD hydrolase-like protein [Clostridia bacterium]|nr:HAD hydrolase-like protein [Clostridia bacterium]